jgi:hypothetical protein
MSKIDFKIFDNIFAEINFKTNINFDFLNQACFDGGFISLKLIKKT